MPFIGNQPALSYTSFAKQDFTTSATTSYTLDQPVANENELALFINFVRQEPTTAYTASGTTLTLTSATSASDDMYCVFLGKAVQTVNPPSGSVGISQLSATGTKDATTFLRGDNTFASAGGNNTPYFYARKLSSQTITNVTTTKVTFDSIILDTNSDWDATNNRFTPQTAGKYFFHTDIMIDVGNVSELIVTSVRLKKNDTTNISYHQLDARNNYLGYSNNISTSNIVDMNGTTDFMEVHAYASDASGNPAVAGNANQSYSSFMAFKLVE